MNEYTPTHIMVEAQLVSSLRDPATNVVNELESKARSAVHAFDYYTKLYNPYLWDGDFGDAPNPTETELNIYRERKNELWLQSMVAVATLHQSGQNPENQTKGAALMEKVTYSFADLAPSVVRTQLDSFYTNWLEGSSNLITNYVQTNQIDKAHDLAAIIRPHLDVTEEFAHLKRVLEQLSAYPSVLAPATIAVIAAA